MNNEDALKTLSLEPGATAEAIKTAASQKKSDLHSKITSAPTDALKDKFQQLLDKVIAAEQTMNQSSSSAMRSPLSATKMADLPGMGSSYGEADATSPKLQPGTLLANRYEIKEQIGAGGMGAVYRAADKNTGDDIALKVLLPALMQNERARERFLDEARISQKLSHPNIVNVFDVQQDGNLFFLTMELLHGQDLRQIMENRKLARQVFSLEEVIDIATAVATGLSYAHKYTIHRDIKPENIWLADNGDIKIMDFGIAQVQSTSQRTKTGAAMGTAYYMAPEQLKGSKDIDGRADQYALAVMVYELLSGEVPAGMIEPLQSHRKDIPQRFAKAVHQALATKPENRFATLTDFTAALMAKNGAGAGILQAINPKAASIAASVIGAIILLVVLGKSGVLSNLGGLLPASAEEQSQQKAGLAKLQGQINVTKQRLEAGRRKLDTDLREAERDKGDKQRRAALSHWQSLSESHLFNGNQIAELEGELAMGETLGRDNRFVTAKASYEKVLAGYSSVLEDFNAAEHLQSAAAASANAKQSWLSTKAQYGLNNPPAVSQAEALEQDAAAQEQQGHFSQGLAQWKAAKASWASVPAAASAQIAGVKQQRGKVEAAAAAQRQAETEKKRLAVEKSKTVRNSKGQYESLGADGEILWKYELSLADLQKYAAAGYVEAMGSLGLIYWIGEKSISYKFKVTEDDKTAVYWFRKAAMAGDERSMYMLGHFYKLGMGGLTESREQAVYWYRKAADGAYPDEGAIKALKEFGLR